MKSKAISVIVPTYNEEHSITETISNIHHVLSSIKLQEYEVIVVNDGSLDDTTEKLKLCDAKVIHQPHNIGYGFALKTGINKAKYDTIIIVDSDGTYPFEEVPELLKAYNKDFDMVVGSRTGKNYRDKYLLRKLLKFLVEFTTGRKIPDINSGLRIFSKKTITPYLKSLCDTFSFTTSLTLAYMMTNKFVHYMPISYNMRTGQSKVRLFRDSLRTLQYILQAINYYNPIKLFLLFSFLCVLGSVIGFSASIFWGLNSGFWLGIGGLLVSLIVLCFGLVADLLRQVVKNTN